MEEEVLQGIVTRVIYKADAGDYCVFLLRDRYDDSIVVTAGCAAPREGDELEVTGSVMVHPKYGEQFKARFFETKLPHTTEGALQYLERLNIKGLGQKSLFHIGDYFGDTLPEVLRERPDEILLAPGVRKGVKEALLETLQGVGALEELNRFFATHGLSNRWSRDLYNSYGGGAIGFIEENPYRLLLVLEGFLFEYADNLARSLGFAADCEERMIGGLQWILSTIPQQGHTCLPVDELLRQCDSLLGGYTDAVVSVMEASITNGTLRLVEWEGIQYIYPVVLHEAEFMAVERTKAALETLPEGTPIQLESLLSEFETETGLRLGDEQREAVDMALQHGLSLITGGPGTGKTTILKALVLAFQRSGLSRIVLCAPTGRAAKRLSEATTLQATTIHRLLEPVGVGGYEFMKNESDPLEADVIIVDEASMLNVQLYDALLAATPQEATIILVGDVDQLPPIGAGFVLRDLLFSDKIPYVRLQNIYRQEEGNGIVENAYRVNAGEMPELTSFPEFQYTEVRNLETMMEVIGQAYVEARATTEDELDVQIIVPMRRKKVGSTEISKMIQRRLLDIRAVGTTKQLDYLLASGASTVGTQGSIHIHGQEFHVGDKVIQNSNNYNLEIFNGEIGTIYGITKQSVMVRFADKEVVIPIEEAEGLSLAYAITVHKSQGSEYKTVIIPFIRAYANMLQRNLLYTAITRAREKVHIIGTKEALQQAVETEQGQERYTLFRERLLGLVEDIPV